MSSNDCTYPFLKRAPRILPGLEEFAVELHTPPDTKPKTFWSIGAKRRAREEYSQYLADTERRITDAEGKYISGLLSMSPGVSECIASAESVSPTLWERTPDDSDFMAARLGTGEIP